MLSHGTFVDYCLLNGERRPALVVRVWTPDCAQLQVFPDKVNDGPDPLGADWFRSSVSRGTGIGTFQDLPFALRFDAVGAMLPQRQPFWPSPLPSTFEVKFPPHVYANPNTTTAMPSGVVYHDGGPTP